MIGLFKAIRDFCLDKDSSFFHFAGLCIHRQLYSAIEASNRKKHQPLNSYLSFFEQGAEGSIGFTSSPEQLVIEQEVSRDLWNRVNSRLSPMEKQVLQFYLDGNNYMQIAGLMKKSPKSVDNALQRIRQKIRQMNHLEERG
jgi:RNA polymerase sporulation-specific sigma factor